MSDSAVQTLLGTLLGHLWQLGAVPTALGRLFHAYHTLVAEPFFTLPDPSLTQLHAILSGAVTVTPLLLPCPTQPTPPLPKKGFKA